MNVREWVDKNRIFECISGSHAYGLNTAESDIDYRGICIAPKEYYFGLNHFEQLEEKDPDRVIFELRKFIKLAADCNPNVIELFFLPEDCVVHTTPIFAALQAYREEFLSKKAKSTYTGYAHAQLKRIKSHRAYLLDPPSRPPTRTEFDLPGQGKMPADISGAIDNVLRANYEMGQEQLYRMGQEEFDCIKEKVISSRLYNAEIMTIYDRERRYRNAKMKWEQYQNWTKTRNVKRAALEAKHHYDTKHASHVARLLIQGEEILSKGTLTVRLQDQDKEFCKSIRAGAFTYDELMEWADMKEKQFETLYTASTLRHSVDRVKIDRILVDTISSFLFG